jgi:hypothetical protein
MKTIRISVLSAVFACLLITLSGCGESAGTASKTTPEEQKKMSDLMKPATEKKPK